MPRIRVGNIFDLFFIGQNLIGRKQNYFAVTPDCHRIIRLFMFEKRGFDCGFDSNVNFFAVFDQ